MSLLLLIGTSAADADALPGTGALSVAGQIPLLLKVSAANAGAAQIGVAGFAPTLQGSTLLLPGVGTASILGSAPALVGEAVVEATVTPAPAMLALLSDVPALEVIQSQRSSSSATTFRHRSSSYKWWEHEPPPAPPVFAPLPEPVQQAPAAPIGLGLAVSGLLALRARLPEPPRVMEIVPEPRNIQADLESEIQRAMKTQRIRRRRREEEFLMLLAA